MTNFRYLVETTVRDVNVILHKSQVPSAIIAQVRRRMNTLVAHAAEHTAFLVDAQETADPQIFCREIAYELADFVSGHLASERRVEVLEKTNKQQREEISRLEAKARQNELALTEAKTALGRYQKAHRFALESLFKEIHILRQRNLAAEEKLSRVNSEAIFDYRKYLGSLLSDQEETILKIMTLQEENAAKCEQIDNLQNTLIAVEDRMTSALREANASADERLGAMKGHLRGIDKELANSIKVARTDIEKLKESMKESQTEHLKHMAEASQAVGAITLGNAILQDFTLSVCEYLIALSDDAHALRMGEALRDKKAKEAFLAKEAERIKKAGGKHAGKITSRALITDNNNNKNSTVTSSSSLSASKTDHRKNGDKKSLSSTTTAPLTTATPTRTTSTPSLADAEPPQWLPLRESLTQAELELLAPALIAEYRTFARRQFQDALAINAAKDNNAVRKIKLMLREGPIADRAVQAILATRRVKQKNSNLEGHVQQMVDRITELQVKLLEQKVNSFGSGSGGSKKSNNDSINNNKGNDSFADVEGVRTVFRDISHVFGGNSNRDANTNDRGGCGKDSKQKQLSSDSNNKATTTTRTTDNATDGDGGSNGADVSALDVVPFDDAFTLSRNENQEGRAFLHHLFKMAITQQQELGEEREDKQSPTCPSPSSSANNPPESSFKFSPEELKMVLEARHRHFVLARHRNKMCYTRVKGRFRGQRTERAFAEEMSVWLRVAEERDKPQCDVDRLMPWHIQNAPRLFNEPRFHDDDKGEQENQKRRSAPPLTTNDGKEATSLNEKSQRKLSTVNLLVGEAVEMSSRKSSSVNLKPPQLNASAAVENGNTSSTVVTTASTNNNATTTDLPHLAGRQASAEMIQQGVLRLREARLDREASSVEQSRLIGSAIEQNALQLFSQLTRLTFCEASMAMLASLSGDGGENNKKNAAVLGLASLSTRKYYDVKEHIAQMKLRLKEKARQRGYLSSASAAASKFKRKGGGIGDGLDDDEESSGLAKFKRIARFVSAAAKWKHATDLSKAIENGNNGPSSPHTNKTRQRIRLGDAETLGGNQKLAAAASASASLFVAPSSAGAGGNDDEHEEITRSAISNKNAIRNAGRWYNSNTNTSKNSGRSQTLRGTTDAAKRRNSPKDNKLNVGDGNGDGAGGDGDDDEDEGNDNREDDARDIATTNDVGGDGGGLRFRLNQQSLSGSSSSPAVAATTMVTTDVAARGNSNKLAIRHRRDNDDQVIQQQPQNSLYPYSQNSVSASAPPPQLTASSSYSSAAAAAFSYEQMKMAARLLHVLQPGEDIAAAGANNTSLFNVRSLSGPKYVPVVVPASGAEMTNREIRDRSLVLVTMSSLINSNNNNALTVALGENYHNNGAEKEDSITSFLHASLLPFARPPSSASAGTSTTTTTTPRKGAAAAIVKRPSSSAGRIAASGSTTTNSSSIKRGSDIMSRNNTLMSNMMTTPDRRGRQQDEHRQRPRTAAAATASISGKRQQNQHCFGEDEEKEARRHEEHILRPPREVPLEQQPSTRPSTAAAPVEVVSTSSTSLSESTFKSQRPGTAAALISARSVGVEDNVCLGGAPSSVRIPRPPAAAAAIGSFASDELPRPSSSFAFTMASSSSFAATTAASSSFAATIFSDVNVVDKRLAPNYKSTDPRNYSAAAVIAESAAGKKRKR